MSRPLIIGAGGQLARAFTSLLPQAQSLGRAELDLACPERIAAALEGFSPSCVFNAAAYTQVDKAEQEEALALRVNAESPAVLAAFCAERDIPLVHFSTDYVFSGQGEHARAEDEMPAPLNAYGRSKLEGEKRVAGAGGKYLIFRTSWVYDATGKNFFTTMLRLMKEREELRVVADQFGAPTYAPHLAAAALKALEAAGKESPFPSGVYHLCNGGATTWHGFARQIAERAQAKGVALKLERLLPITTPEYPLPAPRPLNSRLDCGKAASILHTALPHWQEGLAACMEELA